MKTLMSSSLWALLMANVSQWSVGSWGHSQRLEPLDDFWVTRLLVETRSSPKTAGNQVFFHGFSLVFPMVFSWAFAGFPYVFVGVFR